MGENQRDRTRLARAFGIPLTRPFGALVTGIATAVVIGPAGWIGFVPGALIFAGVGKMISDDRREIARRLREVEAWGFPVDGYREWLLADAPTFEIELRSEVGLDTVAAAVAAVDDVAVVSRRAPRVIRVATPKIELAATKHSPAVRVGDRRLLGELRDRVLAPLHADVGIVRMRMGDFMTLETLHPTQRLLEAGGFRDQALAAPPALQALVHVGTTELAPPTEAQRARHRDERLLYATNRTPAGFGTAFGTTVAALVTGAIGAGFVGAVTGLVCGLGIGIMAMHQNTRWQANKMRRQLDAAPDPRSALPFGNAARPGKAGAFDQASTPQPYGFRVVGYSDWLISGRPIFDVELGGTVEREWVAYLCTGMQWDLTWVDDTLLRIETWPRLVSTMGSNVEPFWGGNPPVFHAIATKLLSPLHQRVGIVEVRMGGYLDRRG